MPTKTLARVKLMAFPRKLDEKKIMEHLVRQSRPALAKIGLSSLKFFLGSAATIFVPGGQMQPLVERNTRNKERLP